VLRISNSLPSRKAVAREREAAAQQRVTELARLNDSLRRSVSGLAAADPIHGFFRVALAEMAAMIRADNGALMVFDPRERSFLAQGFTRPPCSF
jgi:hypothetical protein